MADSHHPVDSAARRTAARLIRQFGNGEITNDEFVDEWPRSKDPAVDEISQRLWFTYDDIRTHRLAGRYALTPEGREYYLRCAVFLELDRPYPRPRLRPNVWSRALLIICTLGLWHILERILGLNRGSVGDYWPFESEEDWLSAKADIGEA